MIVSKPRKLSYFGRKAILQEWRVAKNKYSLRVSLITWDDDKTMSVKVIEGDGRTKNFTVFTDELRVTQERVDELIAQYVK